MKSPRSLSSWIATVFLSLIAAVPQAVAQAEYPAPGKNITLIVPYPPGGSIDSGARLMASGLEKELDATVLVVNKPGAASQVGMSELIGSAPDGYTIAYSAMPTIVTHYLDPSRTAPYTRSAFQPIAMHFLTPQVVAVKATSPFKTLGDFIAAAKENPGKISVADSGLLGTPHLMMLLLERATGAKFNAVHYPGAAPAVVDAIGGHVEVLAAGVAEVLPHYRTGNIRVLALGYQPEKEMPDVKTMKELGYDVQMTGATGILAPAGTPQPIVDKLANAIKKVTEDPSHVEQMEKLYLPISYRSSKEYDEFWAGLETQLGPLLKEVQSK